MYLQKLSVINFKNFSEAELEFTDNINCFVGNNGTGKTNLLDAIYYLSFCKSYFNQIDSQNILHDTDFFVIQGLFENEGKDDTVYCGLKRNNKKQFKLNKKEYERLSEHIGRFPLVMVSPYDVILVTGGSEERRKFLNTIISQYDKTYLNDVLIYQKVLAHRNSLLKQFAVKGFFDRESIELLDEQLEIKGKAIYQKRKEFIEEFIPIFQHYYNYISGGNEEVGISYESQLAKGDYATLLKQSIDKDSILQYTTVGPHKDDLDFVLSKYNIKRIGSQGQIKSFLIALKLAKFDFIKKIVNLKPTLLLDDIFDKLDEERVKKIIELVGSHHFGQIFISDTSAERLTTIMSQLTENFKIFTINNGNVEAGNA